MAGDDLRYDCPVSVAVDQTSTDAKEGFVLNKTAGKHMLLSGRLAAYQDPYPEHKGKASLIYHSIGIMPGDEMEIDGKTIAKFPGNSEKLAAEQYQFFCEYQDTSVTFSTPVPSGFNECSVVTELADPAKAKLTQVYMVCNK